MAHGTTRTHDIDDLRRQYEALNKKKITAEANLATSTQTLENLKREAREKYGTDDLVKLRVKLEQMTQDNERKRAEYQAHLASIEAQLAEVEANQAGNAGRED